MQLFLEDRPMFEQVDFFADTQARPRLSSCFFDFYELTITLYLFVLSQRSLSKYCLLSSCSLFSSQTYIFFCALFVFTALLAHVAVVWLTFQAMP